MKLMLVLMVTVSTIGCGYSSRGYNSMMPTTGNGAPTISQLSPNTTMAGNPGFMLTINGTGFAMGSVVYWNTAAHSANIISANQLTVAISAGDIANAGTVSVYVRSNNQNPNSMNFMVN